MTIAENLSVVAQNVSLAMARRNEALGTGNQVKIVAVTKNQTVAAVREVIDAGALAIGENRVQEAIGKGAELERQTEWHLIGHLQTNKARQAVPLFDLIHSVDSERLAVEIDRTAEKLGKRQDILLQVNVAGEDTKFGLSPDAVLPLAKIVADLAHIRLCGLMAIAPFYDDPEDSRPVFRELYRMYMDLKAMNLQNSRFEWLSMGMTNDYAVAVEEGANLVRVGTAIFGPRHY